jgi:hypothetical protein
VADESSNQAIDQTYWLVHFGADSVTARPLGSKHVRCGMRKETSRSGLLVWPCVRATTALLIAGCAAPLPRWELQPAPVEQVIAEQKPYEIRLTLSSGDRFEVRAPVVVRDTLAGLALRGVARQPQSFAVPVDSVAAVEVPTGYERAKRSMLPIPLGVGLVLGAAALVGLSTM